MRFQSLYFTLVLMLCPIVGHAGERVFRVTDPNSGQPVSNAVVIAESVPAKPVTTDIVQKNRAFHPRILVVPVGSEVHFPNRDNTQHHVYSFSPAKTFDIELYADQPRAPIVFDKAGVVELGCNIHDHMQGFVIVTEHGTSGLTDSRGLVTLDLATEAPVTLHVWHSRLPDNTRMVSMNPDNTGEISLELHPEARATTPMDMLQKRFEEL